MPLKRWKSNLLKTLAFSTPGFIVVAWAIWLAKWSSQEPVQKAVDQAAPSIPRRLARAAGLTDDLEPAQRVVRDYLVKYAPDPKSVEIIDWYEPVSTKNSTVPQCGDTAVRAVYRTRNPFGGMSVLDRVFYLERGRVVHEVWRDSTFPELWTNELHYLYGTPAPRDVLEERLKGLLPDPPPNGQVDIGVPKNRR